MRLAARASDAAAQEALRSTVKGPPSSDKRESCRTQGAEDHRRTQGPLRGERPSLPVCYARQSGSAWPVSPSARPVPTASVKQRPLRKSIVERFAALTRELREKKPVRLAMKLTPSHASL